MNPYLPKNFPKTCSLLVEFCQPEIQVIENTLKWTREIWDFLCPEYDPVVCENLITPSFGQALLT